MTILNVWVASNRALVAFDTKTRTYDGSWAEASKVFHLPHSNLLIGGRGALPFTRSVYDVLHFNSHDYDQAVKDMPVILQSVSARVDEELSGSPEIMDSLGYAQQITLVGWSRAEQCFKGSNYMRHGKGGAFELAEIEPTLISPWDVEWGELPDGDVGEPEFLRHFCTQQVRHAKNSDATGNHAFGGALMVADLRKDMAIFTKVCDFEKE